MTSKEKAVRLFVIGVFCTLYLVTSIISTIHVVTFFELSNSYWMAVFIAVAFEIGAAASLASLVAMERMKMWIVWSLFALLTAMQVNGNLYDAFVNLENFQMWSQLYGIEDQPVEFQKRVIAFVSSLPLPLSALGFIKALVDYVRPEKEEGGAPEPVEEGSSPSSPQTDSDPSPDVEIGPGGGSSDVVSDNSGDEEDQRSSQDDEGAAEATPEQSPEQPEEQPDDDEEGVDRNLNLERDRQSSTDSGKGDEGNDKPYRKETPS